MKGKLFLLILSIFLIMLVSANSDVSVWQGQYYIGKEFQKGMYLFNFTIYDDVDGGNICYSNETYLITGNWGQWKTEQYNIGGSCNNASEDYFLNININGIDQSPRRRLTIFNYLRKDTEDTKKGNLILEDILFGGTPLKIEDVIQFVNKSGNPSYSIYYAQPNPYNIINNVSEAFYNSLIFETISKNHNLAEACFWDKDNQVMTMCLIEEANNKANTIRNSLQIIGNISTKENDENYTLCENINYIDCNVDTTGADLFVQDDIEADDIYANKNILADGNVTVGDILKLKMITNKGGCDSTNHGAIVYEVDSNLKGTHYACRQKKDASGYEWKALY